jgi:hypothetical protein
MIANYYEKENGLYVLQVEPTRKYTIYKFSSSCWKWTEVSFIDGEWSLTASGEGRRLKDCVFAVEIDNQFKPRCKGYPPLNPHSQPQKTQAANPLIQ